MKKPIGTIAICLLLVGLFFSSFGIGIQAAEDPLQKHSESIEQLESEVRYLKESLAGIQEDITEIKKSLAALKASIISLSSKDRQAISEIEDYKGRIADLTRRVEEIEKEQTADNIEIEKSNWMMWKFQANSELYENFDLSVDLKRVEGSTGYYGVLFRFMNGELYYFWIRDDGYYGLSLGKGEEWTVLIEMTKSDAITNNWNKVRVKAERDQISLFSNDELLTTIQDERLVRGKVAVVAETGSDQDYLKVLFNNFSIKELN